ncbi:MAG: sigma-70 family RNA polymerase sigma factor [Bacteroidetes bacterium]|nr:sigma-70 family RNA polymerase sigma factor [Bacteroidota bacterium]
MEKFQLSDNELIQGYLSGKESSLKELIARHQKRIYSSIYLLVKDRELSNDLFQDTFIKVINTLRTGSYHEEGKFLPWVLRIAHNLVIDHFRKQKRMHLVYDTEEFPIFNTLSLSDSNVEEKMVEDQILKQVKMLLDELPDDQREVVIMRLYKDMSFQEIADVTKVSINTALGRMRYALINLRKVIDQKKLMLEK